MVAESPNRYQKNNPLADAPMVGMEAMALYTPLADIQDSRLCCRSRFMAGNAALQQLLESTESIYIPVTVLGELYAGFEISSRRVENRKALDAFLSKEGIEIIAAGKEIADRYGLLVKDLRLKGKPISTNDLWIAATALELGARLISYDSHFSVITGLRVLAP